MSDEWVRGVRDQGLEERESGRSLYDHPPPIPIPQSPTPPLASPVRYEMLAQDGGSAARRGRLITPHGTVETPAFMPVGTQATVKGLTPSQVRATGTQMVLGNTYHLALRPGEDVV